MSALHAIVGGALDYIALCIWSALAVSTRDEGLSLCRCGTGGGPALLCLPRSRRYTLRLATALALRSTVLDRLNVTSQVLCFYCSRYGFLLRCAANGDLPPQDKSESIRVRCDGVSVYFKTGFDYNYSR